MILSLSIVGIFAIIGLIMFEFPSEIERVHTYIAYLNESGIDVKVHFPAIGSGHYIVEATKKIGNNLQHASITSENLLEALIKLVKYIEQEIESWIEKIIYGS